MFERYSLREASLIIQLGHDGHLCPHPHTRDGRMTIIDVSGFHSVSLAYCYCGHFRFSEVAIQLLWLGWMPATVEHPRTAVTLSMLRLFHKLNLQGKLNAYDFYHSLEAVTDSSGLSIQPVSYQPLLKFCCLCRSSGSVQGVFPYHEVVSAPSAGEAKRSGT